MSLFPRIGMVAVFSLLTVQVGLAHGPRIYYGHGPSDYVAPRSVPNPRPRAVVPAAVPVIVTPVPAPALVYPAAVYVARPVPVYGPPPLMPYGSMGPYGHMAVGYSSPGFGFYFGH